MIEPDYERVFRSRVIPDGIAVQTNVPEFQYKLATFPGFTRCEDLDIWEAPFTRDGARWVSMLADQFGGPYRGHQEWTREAFLEEREATRKELAKHSPLPASIIVCDPGDEIICDDCNALIEEPTIYLTHNGRSVECADCLNKKGPLA